MTKIICHCGETLEVELPRIVDFDDSPQMKKDVLAGTFLTFNCPQCGSEVKPESPIRFLEESSHFDLFLIPEMDRSKWFRNRLLYPVPRESRVAIGYSELVEKLRLLDKNLDERAVEILKYTLLSRVLETEERPVDMRIYYKDNDIESLTFYIEGLKDGEIGLTHLPFSAYKKALENLDHSMKQDLFSRILQPPYVSINRLYFEET